MNARVWRIDLPAVVTSLRAWAERLVAEDPAVQAVVLFGSLARGDATAWSDADVLLVLRDGVPLSFEERMDRYRPRGLGIPVEVFPYTASEVRRSLAEGWGMAVPAAREGLLLAERDGAWSALAGGR